MPRHLPEHRFLRPTDRSVPGVRLTLFKDEKAATGGPLDLGMRLLSMTFEDCDDKVDKLSLQLDSFDLAPFDRGDRMAGAVLEVSCGYPGNMSPPRRVVVRSMKSFQALTLDGQALSALMTRTVRSEAKCGESHGARRAECASRPRRGSGRERPGRASSARSPRKPAPLDDAIPPFDALIKTLEAVRRSSQRSPREQPAAFLSGDSRKSNDRRENCPRIFRRPLEFFYPSPARRKAFGLRGR